MNENCLEQIHVVDVLAQRTDLSGVAAQEKKANILIAQLETWLCANDDSTPKLEKKL